MDNVYLALFNFLKFFVKYMPKIILKKILDAMAFLVYFFDKKHRKIVKVNLDLAYDETKTLEEKEKISKECYRNLMYSMADFIDNQNTTKEKITDKIEFENKELFLEHYSKNKKIILLTAHYGNWELLSLGIAAKYLKSMAVVGRDLDSNVMNKILKKNRENFNIELLSKKGALRGMTKALKNNVPVGILVDQNTSEKDGILVDFFGKKVRHTPVAAVLAKKFNAVIIPLYITRSDFGKYKITFYDEIKYINTNNNTEDIKNCVQAQANITQKIIEKKPEEWFWLHKRWKNQYEKNYE